MERRRRALLDGISADLEDLLLPKFHYIDSLGRELDRAEYLRSRGGGEIVFERHDASGVQVRELVPGRAVLVTCLVHDVGVFRGEPFEARYRAVHVCLHAEGGWAFVYGQSTPVGTEQSRGSLDHVIQ